MRAPDVALEPAEPLQVLDRGAAVELPAVGLFLQRLGQVRMQHEAVAAGERRRLLHQPARHGEGRARRDSDLDVGAGPGLVQRAYEAFGLGEDSVDLLHQLVGRKATVGDAEVHRAARRDESQAQLAGRLHFRLDQSVAAAREDVVVVEDGRAAGERELGETRSSCRVLGLGVDVRPHRVELAQPAEEVGLLRAGPCQRLIQVVMSIDEPRGHDRPGQVDPPVGSRLAAVADGRDDPV